MTDNRKDFDHDAWKAEIDKTLDDAEEVDRRRWERDQARREADDAKRALRRLEEQIEGDKNFLKGTAAVSFIFGIGAGSILCNIF